LLPDATRRFREHCAIGIEPVPERIREHVENSLGAGDGAGPADRVQPRGDRDARDGATLRAAALESGYVTAEDFDRLVRPELMVGPAAAGTRT